MRLQKVFCDGFYLAQNFLMLIEHILKFIKIHLELFLLEEDDPSSLWDLDMLSF
jgi:hypothetical protein